MRHFISKISIFLFIFIVLDYSLGAALSFLSHNTKGGNVGHRNYVVNELKDDILIFGSSRSNHHYNPQLMTANLGMSCHNCGEDGEGILLYYGWWSIIKSRYIPKIIIYDIMPIYDYLYEEKDNRKFSGLLKPFFNHRSIQSFFWDVDRIEFLKLHCKMYRYNSYFHQILADFIYPIYTIGDDGFEPLIGQLDSIQIHKSEEGMFANSLGIDQLKISYLNRLVDERDGCQIIFSISPTWYGIRQEDLAPIYDFCDRKSIPLIDFSNNPKYVHTDKWFYNGSHLNSIGADEFTRDFVDELTEIIVRL